MELERAQIRLTGLEIRDYKNVKHGFLSLENPGSGYEAGILGLYGQNGSGKTAVIDALSLLKLALSGESIPARLGEYIHVDAANAAFSFTFRLREEEEETRTIYTLKLKKKPTDRGEEQRGVSGNCGVLIYGESLSWNGSGRMQMLLEAGQEEPFGPKTRCKALIGGERTALVDALVARKLADAQGTSFFFGEAFETLLSQKAPDSIEKKIMARLRTYGREELFVIDTSNAGRISLDALPMTFRFAPGQPPCRVTIPLSGTALLPKPVFERVQRGIGSMNLVLPKIVPGLTIALKDLGTQILADGTLGVSVQLMSHKNSREIPLQYESEGIKKLISVLHLLIALYNRPSITVAIDEMDAGVFEYLLGELLRILSERGKGQLLFTSHNLRPLETLDRGFIAFTTTDPEDRYMRLGRLKGTENLRDFYYRDILLGEQPREIYAPTNDSEIAFAFREAGEAHDA